MMRSVSRESVKNIITDMNIMRRNWGYTVKKRIRPVSDVSFFELFSVMNIADRDIRHQCRNGAISTL